MFEISDEAMELILAHLDLAMEGRPELRRSSARVGLRLNFGQGGARLCLAFPRSSDQVISFMGRPLVIVDPEDYSRLEETRLIVESGLRGKRLSIERKSPEQVA